MKLARAIKVKVFTTEKIFRNLSSAPNPARNFYRAAWLIAPVTSFKRRGVRDDLQMTKCRYRAQPTNFKGGTGSAKSHYPCRREAPITYVLVVDFKGFIHLKEQAQQYAYGELQ